MASYALIKFKINNDFFEWEQAFYGAQPMARKDKKHSSVINAKK